MKKYENLLNQSHLNKFIALGVLGSAILPIACGTKAPEPAAPSAAPAAAAPATPALPAGCVPMNQAIAFSIANANVTYNPSLNIPQSIQAGAVPNATAAGTVSITGSSTGSGTINGQTPDGSNLTFIKLDLPNASQSGSATQQVQGNGNGFITLSATAQQGFQAQNTQQLCISGIAINGSTAKNQQGGITFSGTVYLNFNGGNQNVPLNFASAAPVNNSAVTPTTPQQYDSGTGGWKPAPAPTPIPRDRFDIKPGRFKFKL